MTQTTILFILLALFLIPLFSFIYYLIFKRAINAAIREHRGEKSLGHWIVTIIIIIGLIVYFSIPNFAQQPSLWIVLVVILYIAFEIPYQLVKMAANDIVEDLAAAGNDKRDAARQKAAETLAMIVGRKLKVPCELQSFTSNDEFVFLTYILNNKPIATRLKLNQADKADNWKKLSDSMIANYQKENP